MFMRFSDRLNWLENTTSFRYNCNRCHERSYAQQKNLYRHQRFECNINKQFKCNWCPKKFCYNYQLLAHQRKCHNNNNIF